MGWAAVGRLSRAPGPACLVVYQDDYRPGDVTAAPRGAGRYAVVVARIRPPALLRVSVGDRLPAPGRPMGGPR